MHEKGGPIQNYGACAACHLTKPFHAMPSGSSSGRSRGWDRGGGGGPGRGLFNLFSSQFSGRRGGSQGSKLDFTLVTIEHNGKQYAVPAFPDLDAEKDQDDGRDGSGGSSGGWRR
ncbi:hypothetical protein [Geoalkalibacter halelectricus]|uniref:hypothetical protein n=1 Tax=Geoalkalibacter halelectricus TaxID=2847045 RepID=UPI00266F83AE|nr:hypothetical protein [Geoalkalibacter halelectricus]